MAGSYGFRFEDGELRATSRLAASAPPAGGARGLVPPADSVPRCADRRPAGRGQPGGWHEDQAPVARSRPHVACTQPAPGRQRLLALVFEEPGAEAVAGRAGDGPGYRHVNLAEVDEAGGPPRPRPGPRCRRGRRNCRCRSSAFAAPVRGPWPDGNLPLRRQGHLARRPACLGTAAGSGLPVLTADRPLGRLGNRGQVPLLGARQAGEGPRGPPAAPASLRRGGLGRGLGVRGICGRSRRRRRPGSAPPRTATAGRCTRRRRTARGRCCAPGSREVLVTGMLIRWISVRQRPMAIGAKPGGAAAEVAPRITTRKKNGQHDLAHEGRHQRVLAGRVRRRSRSRRSRRAIEARLAAGDDDTGRRRRRRRPAPGRRCSQVPRDASNRPAATRPRVTAGFRWQPETCPIA